MRSEDRNQRLRRLCLALEHWLDSLSQRTPGAAPPAGPDGRRCFVETLHEFLWELNRPYQVPARDPSPDPDLKIQIRSLLIRLSRVHILSSSIAYARRYFCDRAYYHQSEHPHQRFIYKALDALCRLQHQHSYDDPAMRTLKAEVENRLHAFYALSPQSGWRLQDHPDLITNGPSSLSGTDPTGPNEAALELARLLIRLFFSEGLAVELLEVFDKYEKVIYAASPDHYRDHFVHLIYDFLLGCRILDSLFDDIALNWQIHLGEDQWRERFARSDGLARERLAVRIMRIWLITSLLHDVGYAAESLHYIREKLDHDFFRHVPGFTLTSLKPQQEKYIEQEIDNYLDLLACVLRGNDFAPPLEEIARTRAAHRGMSGSATHTALTTLFRDMLDQLDHGVASAIFLLLTLKVDCHELTWPIDKSRDPAEQIARRSEWEDEYRRQRRDVGEDIAVACTAIATHNMRLDVYTGLSLSINDHPFGFLLMLVDDLHEWDRSADWERGPDGIRAVYGFNVFPRAKEARSLLEREVPIDCTVDCHPNREESFLGYLLSRVQLLPEGSVADVQGEIERGLRAMRRILGRHSEPDRILLRQKLEDEIDGLGLQPGVRALLRTSLLPLFNPVVTLTYIGGDPNRSWSDGSSRLSKMHDTFTKLFTKNLTEGPSICILHGFEDRQVRLFFVAEYDWALREYRLMPGVLG